MKEGAKDVGDIEAVARIAVDCGLQVHRELGPGLLENVYETLLAAKLEKHGLLVERQKVLPIDLPDLKLDAAYRVDLLVGGRLIIEIKALERLASLHSAQLLTYLRLSKQPVGLLMNFGGETFRQGLRRVVNGMAGTA
ncbi:GxxExxY protein [Sphingomonas glaciei]|uniref:GxxExxY protein n=1 Tax=Sphingomonas glaciei TaxID=2938948 RepID=A0ABY5MXL3_9SPHN|nr:GxxExxY protein [Sphingomonas glaciei]UUR08714.1 GxxExxY protein [Sphingomonas glaciei]